MGFSRQEYWSGLSGPPPGHLPNTGIKPGSPALQVDSFPLSHLGSPYQEEGTLQVTEKRVGDLDPPLFYSEDLKKEQLPSLASGDVAVCPW